jgi:hypothetical protein
MYNIFVYKLYKLYELKRKLCALALKSDDPPDKTPCRVNSQIIPMKNPS